MSGEVTIDDFGEGREWRDDVEPHLCAEEGGRFALGKRAKW